MHSPGRSTLPRRVLAGAVAALALSLAGAALPAAGAAQARSAQAVAAKRTAVPTTFRVSSFNVLGHSHTKPGGNRPGWAPSGQRMTWATQLIQGAGIDLVGFQEFEPAQYAKFQALMPGWDLAPTNGKSAAAANSIAWRSSTWTAVNRSSYRAPYFHGQLQDRPLVQLRHNVTGQLVWVLNTHNPANTRGDAKKYRDQAERIQAALVNRLRVQSPGVPVLFLGDMNDTRDFYCPMTYLTELESASGGTHGTPPDGTCATAPKPVVDWIMGTPDIAFSGYTALRDAVVKKTTDHPMVYSDATVAPTPAARAGVRRVVVVDVQGLRPSVLNASRTPYLSWLRDHGASTRHARTTTESAASTPNFVSMLTGRRVTRAAGGHGVTAGKRRPGTVQQAAGQYVSSVFDVAHNLGVSTALYSGDEQARLLARSWNATHGGTDSWGRNNGRRKFSKVDVSGNDGRATSAAVGQIARSAPGLTVLQLGQSLRAGQRSGFGSAAYYRALRVTDRRVGRLVRRISHTASTAGSTVVIVTASTTGLRSARRSAVPLVVWGAGVPHADLYTLNPGYADPGARTPRYTGPQPLRTSDVANLVTGLLRLPPVPRSRFNTRQRVTVLDPAFTTRLSAARERTDR